MAEFVGFVILPNYAMKIMGIFRGLSAAILYYFVPFCPMESPGATILYHVTTVKMACSQGSEIERNFINILLI
jgi:hypothetical protein